MAVRITVKAIIPRGRLQAQAFKDEIRKAMQVKTKPDVQNMFRGTVTGWQNKPEFRGIVRNIQDGIMTRVWPYGSNKAANVYRMVVKGTPPHTIRARKAPMLVYKPGYRPATTPGRLSSRAKQRFGPLQFKKAVRHPGIKQPREFDRLIAEKYKSTFQSDMNKAIRNATIKAWQVSKLP
jgi:hypothetical protein